MKFINPALFCLAVWVGIAGCKPAHMDPAATPPDQPKNDLKQAASDLKEYSFSQKGEFAETLRLQLVEIANELDQLAGQIEKTSESARADAKLRLQTLRTRADKLTGKMGAVREASEATWSDLKTGLNAELLELKDGFRQVRAWLSDKVAP